MPREYDIPLRTLNDNVTETICSEQCGAKCCDFKLNNFSVTVLRGDYARLSDAGFEEMVTFTGENEDPQLLNKTSGQCVFLDDSTNKCSIHDIRPVACRAYPFKKKNSNAIPKWCDLYHHSSQELRKTFEEKPWNELIEDKDFPTDDEYMRYRQEGDLYLKQYISDVITLEGATAFWNIYVTRNYNKKEILKLVKSLAKRYTTKDWYVFSIRYYDKNLDFRFQVNGVTRTDYSILPPHIEQLPPNPSNLRILLDEISTSQKYKEHFIAGIEYPENTSFVY